VFPSLIADANLLQAQRMGKQPLQIALAISAAGLLAAAFTNAPPALIAALAIGALVMAVAPLMLDGAPKPAAVAPVDEAALSERFDRILQTVPAPVVLLDRRGLVLRTNRAALEALPNLRLETPFSFALRDPRVIEAVDAALRMGVSAEVELTEKVPIERISLLRVAPIVADAATRQREALLVTMTDLTAIRRSEAMRADFVANASHELRTPLASILGFVETLQGPARHDEVARERFLGIMAQQGRRMARLIEDLLSLSRIELSAHIRPDTPIDLTELVPQVIDGLSALAYDRGVKLQAAGLEGHGALVLGDRDELTRVFENLIENAIKYGQAGGKVDIRMRPSEADGEAMVTIRDYGPGIAPEHLPRLTERFYRIDVASSRDKGGTGLGLAIVKHILNRHRGRLVIESEAGKGAAFTVCLPSAPTYRQ
jgi:two-component system, OmpR family, phosphate regulon sensor histidine kinase PhoR